MKINLIQMIEQLNKLLEQVPEDKRLDAELEITIANFQLPDTNEVKEGCKFDVTY